MKITSELIIGRIYDMCMEREYPKEYKKLMRMRRNCQAKEARLQKKIREKITKEKN